MRALNRILPLALTPFRSAARFLGLATSLLLATALPTTAQVGTNPVKIFILAGESNMHGKGTVSPATTPGTLDYIVANDPTGKYQFLKSGGSYVVRTDVGIRGLVYSGAPNPGNLTTGYGGNAAGLIGPELGFGHRIGDAYENQVLIVKCGVDGTTLAHSFCPPSSRVGDPEPVVSTDKGFYYKEIIRLVNEAKASLGSNWEIAGLGWHQGWNDRVTPAYSAAYQTNMANFINDIRNDLAAPNMPFVIATAGMDGSPALGYSQVEKAQLKMADPTAYPAFAGNVAVVDTRINYEDLEFWQTVSKSPANEGYHWNRSGKTYLHIGLAMGDAMSLLAPNRIPYRIRSSGGVGGTTLTWKSGTETPTSVRVLRNGVQIAAAAPANPPTFVDASAPLGVVNYELQFTMPGSPCPPLKISHNSGVTDLVARLRANGTHLSWKNNLTYSGIKVKRDGTVIAAALPGSSTSFVDLSPPAGLIGYTVEPTDAGSTPAQVTRKISAIPAQAAVIYEPFDMTATALINEQPGGIGLDGQWVAGTTLGVVAGSLSFGALPTFGNSMARTSGNGSCSINIGTTLADAGLLADGAELWFSFLHREPNNINVQPAFILGNDTFSSYYNAISNSGSGIGVRIGSGKSPEPMVFNAGTYSDGTVQATLTTNQTALIVGKITWGATPGALDTIQIYTPGTDLVLDTPTSHSAVLDQATFNVLSMWGNATAPTMDEIRFGASYQTVIGPGPLHHFAISAISSPQTVGAPITGITLTAQDALNQTATSFTGTVTFGGTGGFSGTSASFVTGVLSMLSVTPTLTGSNLTLTVNDGAGHSGSTTIGTVRSRFNAWAAGPFAGTLTNPNGSLDFDYGGLPTGIEWVVVGDPTNGSDDIGKTPTFDNTTDPNYFIYTYRRSDVSIADANTTIAVQYSSDLTTWTAAVHDGTNIIITPTNDGAGAGIDIVQVKIKRTLAVGGKLFSRLHVTVTP